MATIASPYHSPYSLDERGEDVSVTDEATRGFVESRMHRLALEIAAEAEHDYGERS